MKTSVRTFLFIFFLLLLTPFSSAASKLQVQLKAFNITQNQDATIVKNHPGDVIRYTANVRNLGPDDLVDYEMKIDIKDILKYASIIDLGGGVIEGDYIKYPPILQAFSCNCSNANYFKIKLKDTVCEIPTLSAQYEDVTTTIPIECQVLPPPPKVPTQTGPGFAVITFIVLMLSLGTYTLVAKKVR
jgi:uncharacterized repeat protein (TIGR01451 family)